MKVITLIPAFNEADVISQTLEAVLSIPAVESVFVIDDGSRDDTARVSQQAGAQGIHSDRNRGKGAALQSGAEKILSTDFDIVLFLDADLGASAREADYLFGPVANGLADMTIGILPKPATRAGFGVVKDLARSAIRDLGGGYDAQAPLSGQRALSRDCLKAVLPFADGYGVEVGMTIRALKQNLRVYEVMVEMQHRTTGRDLPGFFHRGKQYLDVHRTIRQLTRDRQETNKG